MPSHTVFYTDLPHYFMEFDILDKRDSAFLGVERGENCWIGLPFVSSAKALHTGVVASHAALLRLIGPSELLPETIWSNCAGNAKREV